MRDELGTVDNLAAFDIERRHMSARFNQFLDAELFTARVHVPVVGAGAFFDKIQ